MITLSRYRGTRAEIDPDQDQKLITVPRKTMKNEKDLLISKDGHFYVIAWQIFNGQETTGFYQVSTEEVQNIIKCRHGEMNKEQKDIAEKRFPGVFMRQ